MTDTQSEGWLVIKPDGNYLTTTKTLGDARRVARDFAKQYGRTGWRFIRPSDVAISNIIKTGKD
jgi:hypothetical protein